VVGYSEFFDYYTNFLRDRAFLWIPSAPHGTSGAMVDGRHSGERTPVGDQRLRPDRGHVPLAERLVARVPVDAVDTGRH
jgi:hypothetical protein